LGSLRCQLDENIHITQQRLGGTTPLLGVKVITMGTKETTSTSTSTGEEVNKGSDLAEILRKDGRTILDHSGPEYLKPEQLLEVLISPGYKGKTAAEGAANLLHTFGDIKDVFTASIPQLKDFHAFHDITSFPPHKMIMGFPGSAKEKFYYRHPGP